MKSGAWHQCGYNSQKLVVEELENGAGVGVILSARDLAFENWADYAVQYRALGASVVLDPQFYVPDSTQGRLATYPTAQHRASISSLLKLSDTAVSEIAKTIEEENKALQTSAIIAPAIPYEASRADIVETNQKLFQAAKAAGTALGIPTYATVVMARSLTSDVVINEALSDATTMDADGWYFAFEFEPERLPTDAAAVLRMCSSILTLACSGKPVLHACAGPLALLSFGAGATATGIGHTQNLWTFNRNRFEQTEAQGGGGAAPARFFSSALWGTIVQPDETILLPNALREEVMTHSPFSGQVKANIQSQWSRWEAGKHLVSKISETVQPLATITDSQDAMKLAIDRLVGARKLYQQIAQAGIAVKDGSDNYQAPWASAAGAMLKEKAEDYEFLALVKK